MVGSGVNFSPYSPSFRVAPVSPPAAGVVPADVSAGAAVPAGAAVAAGAPVPAGAAVPADSLLSLP